MSDGDTKRMSILFTIPSLTLVLGSLLCENRVLCHLMVIYNVRYSSWLEEGFFCACTVIQLFSLVMYMCMRPIKHYCHFYEVIFMPLLSISFLKQLTPFEANPIINPVRISVFIVGWVLCLIMVIIEYARYPQQESESLIKISTTLRLIKLVKRLVFAILVGFNIVQPIQITFILMLAISVIQCYTFIMTFTFQNPFHEFLLMISTFSSLFSWIDFLLFYQGITNYAFIGEVFFILVFVFNPQIFQKALEMKYQLYGESNIQTRKITELLAVFVVMKEIILNQRKSLKYTEDFENKMFTLLQKMVAKNKIQSESVNNQNFLKQRDFLTEDQLNFLKVLQKRLKQSQQFIAYQFYLTTIIRKGFNFKNKALGIYYQRVSEKTNQSMNIFNRIEMKMLYHHLMNQIQQKGKNQIHHAVLNFSQSLNQLKGQVMNLCKHQISVVNLFQNSSNVPIQKYSAKLLKRHGIKQKIKEMIDFLNSNIEHIHSGAFLYITLLYKIIFERQQIIIGEKISQNFIIPLAEENQKSQFLISQYRNISIFVFSSQLKGLILNENQYFSKTYGRTVRIAQKSKKYVSQLFLSTKQKTIHQDMIESSTKYEGLQINDHSSYECWIRRRVALKGERTQDEQQRLICVVEKVRISARIYYQQQQVESFLCTIQQLESGYEMRLLSKDLQMLKKFDVNFQTTKQQTLQQLEQKLDVYYVVNKSNQETLLEDEWSQDQSQANFSQNLMFNLDLQSLQRRKIQKIEKQYDRQEIQFDSRRIATAVLMGLPIVVFLVNVGLIVNIDLQIQQSLQIMEYQKQMFEKTLINQKYVGLNLMLYQLVITQEISNTMCTNYGVTDLKNYTVQNLRQFAINSFDEILLTQIQGVIGDDSLQQLFDSRYYQSFELKDTSIWMNYALYASLTKSNIFQYATVDTVVDEWSVKAVANAINVTELQFNGLYFHLREMFADVKKDLQSSIQYYLIIINIVEFFLFIILIFAFYRLITYKYNHILLLRDFKRNYVKGRIRQMEYIMVEMSKLQKNEIYDIHIDKLMTLKITRESHQHMVTFQELQKLSFANHNHNKNGDDSSKSNSLGSSLQHQEEEKQYLVDGNETLKERHESAPIMIMFSFHKYKVLGLLIFILLSVGLNISQYNLLTSGTQKNFQMEELFQDMAMLLMVMQDLAIGEVVNYRGTPLYADKALNDLWIGLDIDELQHNSFQQHIYELFSSDIESTILYRSYCHRAVNVAECEKIKGGVLTNGMASLIGLLPKDYNLTWGPTYQSDSIIEQQICEKIIIYMNFTVKELPLNLIEGYNDIESGFTQQQTNLKIGIGAVTFLFILGIGIVAEIIIGRGRKVRAQVLSMDTKINLYRHQQSYRTLLNTLYYKQERDLMF